MNFQQNWTHLDVFIHNIVNVHYGLRNTRLHNSSR